MGACYACAAAGAVKRGNGLPLCGACAPPAEALPTEELVRAGLTAAAPLRELLVGTITGAPPDPNAWPPQPGWVYRAGGLRGRSYTAEPYFYVFGGVDPAGRLRIANTYRAPLHRIPRREYREWFEAWEWRIERPATPEERAIAEAA